MNGILDLASKIFWRDLIRGDLNTLIGALMLAVAAISATGSLSDRLEITLTEKAGDILGADLVIRGRSAAPKTWYDQADHFNLRHCESVEFSSMLVQGDTPLLVAVKAVETGYPLRGNLLTEGSMPSSHSIDHLIPGSGEAWVDPTVLNRLNLKIGDDIQVGEKTLQITRMILREPDRRNDFTSLSPRVLINHSDVDATGVIQPGSQILFLTALEGSSQALHQFRAAITPTLRADQKVSDLAEDRPELSRTLQKTRQFMSFLSLAVVMIAGVSIALSTQDYVRRHTRLMALLRCLGTRNQELSMFWAAQLLGMTLIGSFLGVLLGFCLEEFLAFKLAPIAPSQLAEYPIASILIALSMGCALVSVFALPHLMAIKKRSVNSGLRVITEGQAKQRIFIYTTALSLIAAILAWHLGDITLMGTTLAIGILVVFILLLGARIILKILHGVSGKLPFSVRLGTRRLFRQPSKTLIQITGFTLTFASIYLILALRNDLIDDWMGHLAEDAPNYFAINLFDHDLPAFSAALDSKSNRSVDFYPVVRGRLISIRGEPALQIAKNNARAESAINRDLALTFTSTLPRNNRITAGNWHPDAADDGVSVEAGLAEKLSIQPGDTLQFDVLGERFVVTVTSIRSVQWDQMTPNFFFILPKHLLDSFPRTWMTSFYLAPEASAQIKTVAHQFPSASLIEVGQMVEQIRGISNAIASSLLPLNGVCLAAGFFAVVAGIFATRQDRLREDRLLRILGAAKQQLRLTQIVEFVMLGGISGLYGALVSESIRWVLYTHLLEIPFSPNRLMLLLTPWIGALILTLVGLWASPGKRNIEPFNDSED